MRGVSICQFQNFVTEIALMSCELFLLWIFTINQCFRTYPRRRQWWIEIKAATAPASERNKGEHGCSDNRALSVTNNWEWQSNMTHDHNTSCQGISLLCERGGLPSTFPVRHTLLKFAPFVATRANKVSHASARPFYWSINHGDSCWPDWVDI